MAANRVVNSSEIKRNLSMRNLTRSQGFLSKKVESRLCVAKRSRTENDFHEEGDPSARLRNRPERAGELVVKQPIAESSCTRGRADYKRQTKLSDCSQAMHRALGSEISNS